MIVDYGTNVLFPCIAIFTLWMPTTTSSSPTYLYYYVIGYVISVILNLFLKRAIRQPRPKEDTALLSITTQDKQYLFREASLPYSIYGMPSFTSQMCFYSSIYLLLSLPKGSITGYFLLLLSVLASLMKFLSSQDASFLQIIVGAAIGMVMASAFHFFSKRRLRADRMEEKKDDNNAHVGHPI